MPNNSAFVFKTRLPDAVKILFYFICKNSFRNRQESQLVKRIRGFSADDRSYVELRLMLDCTL